MSRGQCRSEDDAEDDDDIHYDPARESTIVAAAAGLALAAFVPSCVCLIIISLAQLLAPMSLSI